MKPIELVVDQNIRLKEIGFEHLRPIFKTIDSQRDYLAEWLPFVELTLDISYTNQFIENYLNSDKINLTFAITYQKQFAGIIGLKDTDLDNQKTEIGYWLSVNQQSHGIITNSCKTLIDYVFQSMNINRIQIKAATENLKSRAIPERLGFTFEGIERDAELHTRGFVDLAIYGLLKNDWLIC
ncbi:MAG: GNAT family protein [Paludibacter sp.]|jgi:ribosomal-protein-serine acetyltransferase